MTTFMNAYSVFDKTAESFAVPFFAPNDEVAKRNFRFSLKKLDDLFVVDLQLYRIGAFDNVNGMFVNDYTGVIDTGTNVLSEREIEKKNSEVKQ